MKSETMIKTIKGHISRAKHYGANDREAYELTVSVGYDSKWFAGCKRKKINPIKSTIVDIKNAVTSATNIRSMPYVQSERDWPRASKGIKTIRVTFFVSKWDAEALGVDVSKWSTYMPIELQSHYEATRGNLFAKSAIDKVLNESNKDLN